MTSAICNTCEYKSTTFGDIKPYLSDRTDEFALYSNDNDNYVPLCSNCWRKQDELDMYLYNEMKIPVKNLTWDKPFPKDHKDVAPIINNNITYNTTNINYNTSNLIPTYNTNTTNNNITKITKIIDPDGIIDPFSSDYKRVLRNANKYKVEREKKDNAKQKLAKEQELLKKLDVEMEIEAKQCAIREKEQLEEEKRKTELHEAKIKLDDEIRKKIRRERNDKKENEIEAIEKEYNVTFGELSSVEQPDETLKKYHNGLLICLCCSKCKVFKAYPNGYLDSYGRLNENRIDKKDICSECLLTRSQLVSESMSCNMVKCACGVLYYGATFEAIHKHETSPRHIKALGRNKTIGGKTYSVLQLRKICNANISEDGSLKAVSYTHLTLPTIYSV